MAIFVSAIFLFLNIAVEFSHQHVSQQSESTAVTDSSDEENETADIQGHSYSCVACLFGLTQLAPALAPQILKPHQESIFTAHNETTYYLVVLQTPYRLRAPPSNLS